MARDHRQFVTFATADDPFRLAAGGCLPQVTIAYETWGKLSPKKDNLILVTTGLSASSHVASHGGDDIPGWWEEMVGPGRAVDTNRWFVVCTNILGSCFGSTGPADNDPRTGRPYATTFPTLLTEDMVEAQVRVLDHLGVSRARAVLGASLGGMLALQWGAQHPDRTVAVCGIATPGRSYAFSIAWRAVQRRVVMSDPAWQGGDYAPGQGPVDGLTNARAIGILSYRSHQEFDARFGPHRAGSDPSTAAEFPVESYLQHNAGKFGTLFDANAYLCLARAMDHFDLGRGASSYEDGVARITVPCLLVGFTSDHLFPLSQQREVADILQARDRPVEFHALETIHGHDAFLIEIEPLGRLLRRFLDSPPG